MTTPTPAIIHRSRLHHFLMVAALLIGMMASATVASAQAADDPGQLFLGAFMRLQSAEKMEADGELFDAYGEYRRATLIYDQIASQHPSWKPGIISHRRVSIRRKMNEIANALDKKERNDFNRNIADASQHAPVRPATNNRRPVPSTTAVRPPSNNHRKPAVKQRSKMEDNLRSRITTLEKMVVDGTKQRTSLEKALAKSGDARKLAEYELKQKRGELSEMQRKLAAAEEGAINKSLDLQRKLTAAEKEVLSKNKEVRKQFESMQKTITLLEGQLKESRERENQTASKVTDLTTKLAEAGQVITGLRSDVASVTKERDELVVLLKASSQDAAMKATALRKQELEEELKLAHAEIARLKEAHDQNATTNTKEVAQLRQHVVSLENELKVVREENVAFKREITTLRGQLEDAQVQLANAAPTITDEALVEENKTLRQIVRRQLQAQAWRGHTKRLIQSELARLEIGSRSLLRLLDKMEGKDVVTAAELGKINDPYIQAAGNRSGLTGAFFGGTEAGTKLNDPDAQAALDESMVSPEQALANEGLRFQIESMAQKAADDFSSGRFDNAAETYRLIVEADPTDIRMRCNLGVCLIKDGSYDESAEHFHEAVKLDDSDPFAFFMLGMAEWKLGDLKKSSKALHKSLEIKPTQHAALNLLGVVAMEQKNYQDSEIAFNKALKVRTTYAEAHRNMAILFSKPGNADPVRSMEHYRESLKHGAPRSDALEDFLRYNDVNM